MEQGENLILPTEVKQLPVQLPPPKQDMPQETIAKFANHFHNLILAAIAVFVILIVPSIFYFLWSDTNAKIKPDTHLDASVAGLTNWTSSATNSLYVMNSRIGKLEKKPELNLSVINASISELRKAVNFSALEANISLLQEQLAIANRQIGFLLTAQNGSCSTDVVCSSQQENVSQATTSAYLLRYMNLTLDANGKTCRDRLVATFCAPTSSGDWCRRTLDPEWLCSASSQMEEYAIWNGEACSCARELGLPY